MTNGDLIRRGDALTTLIFNAWKHEGSDDYSRGMDAGSLHQSKCDHDAILSIPAVQSSGAKPLTAEALADALSCFWNAALSEARNQQEGFPIASIMACGFAAVEIRLREFAAIEPAPASVEKGGVSSVRVCPICDIADCETHRPSAEQVAPTLAEALRLPKIAALVEALIYLVDECDEDIDDDYNPHAAPLARARATLSALEGGE